MDKKMPKFAKRLLVIVPCAIAALIVVAGCFDIVPAGYKGVKLTMDGDDIIIDCNVILYYGNSIAEIARAIQEKVAASVQAMTGLSVKKVNVHVGGINLAKKAN